MSRIIKRRKLVEGEHGDYFENAVIKCDCGRELELYSSWASECDHCNREYNGSGQLLAAREQWGWETGESF